MRPNFARALSCVSKGIVIQEYKLTDVAVHGARSNIPAGWIKADCKHLARVACQFHDGRLEGTGLPALWLLSAQIHE
jgi:hypothetical protein